MPKPTNKKELLLEIKRERAKFEALLAEIPPAQRGREVCDGMSVKDFLAHRAEWGAMMIRWYQEAASGEESFVPHKDYKWSQLPELNASIARRYRRMSLKRVEKMFDEVHDELFELVSSMSNRELYNKGVYAFTKSSNLATYVNSATAAHYRSAGKHIRKWWKAQQARLQVHAHDSPTRFSK